MPAIWGSEVPRDAARRGPVCVSRPVGQAAPMCPMKRADIKDGWYKARAELIGGAEDGARARPGERRARRDGVACVAMPGPIS